VDGLLLALERGCQVVLANKKPLTVVQDIYDGISRAPSKARWETTVGAGLPVIATLNRLVASGDGIERVAGSFSGTLGYLMTGLEEGRSFSETVAEAYRLGYTEPDPRDDLGGVDVARKALILARGMGWRVEMEEVEVRGLYPERMAGLSVDEFLEALPALNEEYRRQVEEAAADGKVLRYAATLSEGACSVGPTAVAKDSPLGRLTGTDNLVELYSRWYSPNPLVIQGRGAGVEATAAGVLSDVVELRWVG
jgi:aspartokinase/homoserine dehydrogenase 1